MKLFFMKLKVQRNIHLLGVLCGDTSFNSIVVFVLTVIEMPRTCEDKRKTKFCSSNVLMINRRNVAYVYVTAMRLASKFVSRFHW